VTVASGGATSDGTDSILLNMGSNIGSTVRTVVSTVGNFGLQFEVDVNRSGGVNPWGLRVSNDGVNWTSVGPVPWVSGWNHAVFDLSSLAFLDDQPTVFLELTTSAISLGGSSAIDNVVVSALQTVPEHTTTLLLAGGLAGLAAAGRRRSLH